MNSSAGYRPDIDGLRAIAVLAVIVFHMAPKALVGGFVGVDIFFVISGYLITGLIVSDLERGTFSFWSFYERRIRRIYPALILMVVITLLAGWGLLVHPEYAALGRSAAFAALGVSNLEFWRLGTHYFSMEAERMPLLHTWSLGVEEQFYLIWPLLLVAAWRLRLQSRKSLIVLPIAVIVLSLWRSDPLAASSFAFFTPVARAWELALGALLVFLPTVKSRWLSDGLAIVGSLSLLLSILALKDDRAPLFLLVPCLGSAFLVWPRTVPSIAGKVLSYKPLRAVGLISYSLYHWHWPLLVLLRDNLLLGTRLNILDGAAYLVMLSGLSILSYLLVERPLRRGRSATRAFVGAALAAALVVSAGVGLHIWQGVPERWLPEAARFASALGMQASTKCLVNDGSARLRETGCIRIDQDRANVLLLGDSHMNQYREAFSSIYPEIAFSQAAVAGCTPVLPAVGEDKCDVAFRKIFARDLAGLKFDAVILSSRLWNAHAMRGLDRTLVQLRLFGGEVILFGPNPEYRQPLPVLLAYATQRGVAVIDGLDSSAAARDLDLQFSEAVAGTSAKFVSIYSILCPEGQCARVTRGGASMMRDDDHLSPAGALAVVTQLRNEGFLSEIQAVADVP